MIDADIDDFSSLESILVLVQAIMGNPPSEQIVAMWAFLVAEGVVC